MPTNHNQVPRGKKSPTVEIANPAVEAKIRIAASKPTGELTKADLEKVTELTLEKNQLTTVQGLEKLPELWYLDLKDNQLTDVKGLESFGTPMPWSNKKLTQLKELILTDNPDLTKAQIAELQKALPKCKISSNPTK